MKNIVRILSLSAALALASIPATSVEPLGPCRYSCCSTSPFQCQSFTVTTTQSQCCNGTGLYCPEGTSLRNVSWGNPARRCAI